jgi:RNA polymerase sigma-70 factor (ECF subfamily)
LTQRQRFTQRTHLISSYQHLEPAVLTSLHIRPEPAATGFLPAQALSAVQRGQPPKSRHVNDFLAPAGVKWTRLALHTAASFDRPGQADCMGYGDIIALLALMGGSLPEDDSGAHALDVAHLIRLAQRGDREAVATLYQAYVTRIYRYVAARLPGGTDAEDITADVFVRMVEGLPGYQVTGAPFEAWLYRIAATRVADFYRSRAKSPSDTLDENLSDEAPLSEEMFSEAQALDELRRALHQLPEEHQTILVLRFVERKSHEDVAALLGKSAAAVKSIQHRALSRLTELLGSDHKARHYLRGGRE